MKKVLKSVIFMMLAAFMLLSVPGFAATAQTKPEDPGAFVSAAHDVELVPQYGLHFNGKEQPLFKSAKVTDGVIWYRVSSENLWKQLPLEDSEDWTQEEPTAQEPGEYYILVYIESTKDGCRSSGSRAMPMACFRVTIAP